MGHEKTYHTIDKTGWGPGPWTDEPDKLQWIDETTGLDCLIVRNGSGALCGYVGLPPEHPWHGADYGECRGASGCDGEIICSCRPDIAVEVHGGLTFAGPCRESDDPSTGICHVPEPGRPDDVWWLGFDCAHAWDIAPGMAAREREFGLSPIEPDQVYRDVGYVRHEVRGLAKQLAEVGK